MKTDYTLAREAGILPPALGETQDWAMLYASAPRVPSSAPLERGRIGESDGLRCVMRLFDARDARLPLRVFEFAHVAYEELLEVIGQPIPQDLAKAPYIIPVVHTKADYRAALRLGDRIRGDTRVTRLRARSFTLHYDVRKADGTLAAEVETQHVVVDATSGKAMTMPAALSAGLRTHLATDEADLPGSD